MRLLAAAQSVPKAGRSGDENEDAFELDDAKGRYAVADGRLYRRAPRGQPFPGTGGAEGIPVVAATGHGSGAGFSSAVPSRSTTSPGGPGPHRSLTSPQPPVSKSSASRAR